MTPEEILARATHKIAQLGLAPDAARDLAQWRDRRDSAIVYLAASADWNAALLREAAYLSPGHRNEDPAKEILFQACDYCPRASPRT